MIVVSQSIKRVYFLEDTMVVILATLSGLEIHNKKEEKSNLG